MEDRVKKALATDRVIDITTVGRRSGNQIRKEMWFHNVDGEVFITGTPGARDWYANVVKNPEFIFHLKESTRADLDAVAQPITDPDAKRDVLEKILAKLERSEEIDRWVSDSPLIHVEFPES